MFVEALKSSWAFFSGVILLAAGLGIAGSIVFLIYWVITFLFEDVESEWIGTLIILSLILLTISLVVGFGGTYYGGGDKW